VADFIKIWNLLAVSYPAFGGNLEPSALAETLLLYERLLSDLPDEALRTAALRHIATSKWFPTVAELRTAAAEIVNPSSAEQTAIEAWGDVVDTFGSGECYAGENLIKAPVFNNPLTTRAVRALGGWVHLCHSDNEPADRARFIQVFEQLQVRERSERILPASLRANQAPAALAPRRGWQSGAPEPPTIVTLPGPRTVGALLTDYMQER
jgi:hypothetical protein